MNAISIIVPTLNEVDNIGMLVSRIAAGFTGTDIRYEIVFIDDHSTDGTVTAIQNMSADFPVRCILKKGERGKAYSLLEGFEAAEFDVLCMIDADLQYPPEAILPMYRLMQATKTDIVLTNRQDNATSRLRKVTSSGFNFVFTKLLFGFDYDSQSGLKLFKRKVIDSVTLTPTPWSFDLEFIVRSLEQNYKIVSYDISFAERYAGVAKIQVSKVAVELAKASVKLRFNSSPRRVKQAYKTNNHNLQRVMTTSLIALVAGCLLALGNSAPVTAISFIKPTAIIVQPPATVEDLVAPPAPIATTPQPVQTTPNVVSPPTALQTVSPTPTVQNAPVSSPITASPDITMPAVKPQTSYTNKTYSSPQLQIAAAVTTTIQTSPISSTVNDIRYPALAKQADASYSYPDHHTSRAASYIRPLGITAIGLFVTSAAGYIISQLVARLRSKDYQPRRFALGSTEI